MTEARREWTTYALVATAAVIALYAHTLSFGFFWDDFDVIRPWSWQTIGHAFTGDHRPWAREGINFYRPLTSVYWALISNAVGFDARALHVIPLVTLSAAASLAGLFAGRDAGSRAVGVIATLLYAVHPLTASAVGPWIGNQYQGFLVIAVLIALLIWQRQSSEGLRLTPGLAAVLVAAAWLKEDGILLGPTLVVLQAVRAAITADVPRPARRSVLSLAGLAAALILWRAIWLPNHFGYGFPGALEFFVNLSRAWRQGVLGDLSGPPLSYVVSAAKVAVAGGALWIIAKRRNRLAGLALAGLTLCAVMNVPLGMISLENRWHVVGLGVVLMSAAVIGAIRTPVRWLAAGALIALCATAAWPRIESFAPCSQDSLFRYKTALEWPELPAPLRSYLAGRPGACAAGRFDSFTTPMRDMVWGER